MRIFSFLRIFDNKFLEMLLNECCIRYGGHSLKEDAIDFTLPVGFAPWLFLLVLHFSVFYYSFSNFSPLLVRLRDIYKKILFLVHDIYNNLFLNQMADLFFFNIDLNKLNFRCIFFKFKNLFIWYDFFFKVTLFYFLKKKIFIYMYLSIWWDYDKYENTIYIMKDFPITI